ncbi:MAG: class C sortase [Corynebacterium sp.]|uniref:class C sortase n=1 Tax=Corynebacterium sp. TaxID=1720 RepID=UPI0026DD733D|nr:class C sortase [Corynebacterium sp.]MDO5030781.1 class C sortase [Corynebacterium sp.]
MGDEAQVEKPEAGKHRQPKKNSLLLPALIVVLGMLVMLYPVISTVWNNHGTTKAAEEYAKLEKGVPQEVLDTQWDSAHAYNENRNTGPILDPWLARIDDGNAEYAAYLKELSETDAMARLVIPSIKVDLPVYHGTEDKTLQKGLGHLYGSDLPVGGEGTHSVITGHTGLSNATLFDNLSKVKEGDAFYVQVTGHKLKYVVDQIKVVLPNETEGLRPVAGKDYITLITCTPYGINTHRLLVRGHQVPMDENDAAILDQTHGPGWQWWMYALVAAAVLVGAGLGWWLWRQKKKADETDEVDNNSESDDNVDESAEESTEETAADSDEQSEAPQEPNDDQTSWWEREDD